VKGRGILELVCRRDVAKHAPPIRERFDPRDKALEEYQGVYEKALDRCWARWGLDLPGGEFATEIKIPEESRGACHLRLSVANQSEQAMGATNLYVRTEATEPARTAAASGR
jgi:hypothetical protein